MLARFGPVLIFNNQCCAFVEAGAPWCALVHPNG